MYVGKLLTATDDECLDGIDKLWMSIKIWYYLDRILGREGADTQMSGSFNVAVIQAILLFRLEMWEVTPCIKGMLGGSHNRVERRISGKMSRRQADGTWD